jgi:hypothetical protein
MKLSAARRKAWEALHQMQGGLNPNQEKRKLVTVQRGDDWAEAKWTEITGLDADPPLAPPLLAVPAER